MTNIEQNNLTSPSSPELSKEQLLAGICDNFKQAMDYRLQMNMRVAKRMTILIRGLMFVAALVLLSLFALITILTENTNNINNTITTINNHFSSMTENMHEVRVSVNNMERNIRVMPHILEKFDSMTTDIDRMNSHINSLSENMSKINHYMSFLDHDILLMSQTFSQMDRTVHRIDVDVNNLSSPMKMYQ